MSDQNDEITLAHDEYITANNVNVNDLPAELDSELDSVNALIDKYEADASDANFDAVESASKELAGKIKAWHEANQKPKETPKALEAPKAPEAPKAVEPKQTEPAPVAPPKAPTPAQVDEDEEEDDSWSFTKYLK